MLSFFRSSVPADLSSKLDHPPHLGQLTPGTDVLDLQLFMGENDRRQASVDAGIPYSQADFVEAALQLTHPFGTTVCSVDCQ
eukprot:3230306-Amphidinium_carterae.1